MGVLEASWTVEIAAPRERCYEVAADVPGSPEWQGTLEQVEVAAVTPGLVQPYLRGEVHCTRQLSPDGSVVLRFLSGDVDRAERYRYDPATGRRTRL